MKNLIIVSIFLLSLVSVFSQDLELYHRFMEDRLTMPEIPEVMIFSEFQILSRDIRLMDLAAGIAFPGYISFKAQENSAAYISIAVRSIGYAGALFELYRYHNTSVAEYWTNDFDRNVMYGTIGIILSSYIFDWLYGKTKLELKQEEIRYRYRQKIMETSTF